MFCLTVFSSFGVDPDINTTNIGNIGSIGALPGARVILLFIVRGKVWASGAPG